MFDKSRDRIRLIMGFFLNYPYFWIKSVVYGRNIKLYGKLDLHVRRKGLSIGDDAIFRSGMATNPLGGSNRLTFATCGGGILLLETMLALAIVVSERPQ